MHVVNKFAQSLLILAMGGLMVAGSAAANEKKDMAKDNGHLTKKDQRQLNREANHMSKRIYADKHNAKAAK
jgi:hypothetical protein